MHRSPMLPSLRHLPPSRRPTTSRPDATISDTAIHRHFAHVRASIYMKEAVLQPGDLIGARYKICHFCEGGMGAVYKALDREVERTVASN